MTDPSAPLLPAILALVERLSRTPAGASSVNAARPASVPTSALVPSAPLPLPTRRTVRWWSHPWPDELRGLGRRRVIPHAPCALCPRWTFAAYGTAPLCLDCAPAATTPARVAYREALRRVWTLAAEEERADPTACVTALDDLARRLDDVGEPAATELRRRWARDWHRETGHCPTCGERGPLHGAG